MPHVQIRRLVLLALLLLVAGCASNNKGKIEGTKWTSQATTIKGKSLAAGLLQLEFRSDGSLIYRAGQKTLTGTYSVGMLNTVHFNLDEPLAGSKTHAEKIVIDNDHLTMTDADGTELEFVKVTAEQVKPRDSEFGHEDEKSRW